MRDLFEEISTVQLRIRQHSGETMQTKAQFTLFSEFVLNGCLENVNWEPYGLRLLQQAQLPAAVVGMSEIAENTPICIYTTMHTAVL